MANTTARVVFTRSVTYTFTADYPGWADLTDQQILDAASLPNGTLSIGELLAGSSTNNGSITPGAWSITSNTDIEPYVSWTANTGYAVGTRVTPTAGSNRLYTVALKSGASGTPTTGSTEPTWPTTVGQTVDNGTVTFTCINKF